MILRDAWVADPDHDTVGKTLEAARAPRVAVCPYGSAGHSADWPKPWKRLENWRKSSPTAKLTLPEPPPGQPRDPYDPRCYGRQGIFLARHGYLLLAFSNGLDSGKVGGTSQTVAMQRGELYPLFVQVDEVIAAREPGVVVEVTTPRQSDDPPPSLVMQSNGSIMVALMSPAWMLWARPSPSRTCRRSSMPDWLQPPSCIAVV